MMKIYIAGSITNDPNYKEHFKKVKEKILKLGHVPLNPCKKLGFEYKEYIDMGLNELMQCDAIVMLDGWENSDGAKLERHYAITVGLLVMYD